MQLVIMGRRHNSNDWGLLSRLSDENYLYRNGKLALDAFVRRAETEQIRWLATLGYMFEDVRVQTVNGDPVAPNVKHCLSAETNFVSKTMKHRAEQKARRKK
jgi:hypothetical protein